MNTNHSIFPPIGGIKGGLKFLSKAATCLAICAMGFVTTSCDDDVLKIIDELVTNIVGQQGTVYSYQVSGTAQRMTNNGNGYAYGAAAVNFTGVIPVTVNGSYASIKIPAMTVDGIRIGDVTFSQLGLTPNETSTYTVMYMTEEGVGVEGSAIVDGNEINITNLFIDDARLTSDEMYIKKLQIFFGDNGEYVLEIKDLTGKVSQ